MHFPRPQRPSGPKAASEGFLWDPERPLEITSNQPEQTFDLTQIVAPRQSWTKSEIVKVQGIPENLAQIVRFIEAKDLKKINFKSGDESYRSVIFSQLLRDYYPNLRI